MPQVSDETWYAVVAGQGDIKNVIKIVSCHNADKYGELGELVISVSNKKAQISANTEDTVLNEIMK